MHPMEVSVGMAVKRIRSVFMFLCWFAVAFSYLYTQYRHVLWASTS
jgi:hypothetical protein